MMANYLDDAISSDKTLLSDYQKKEVSELLNNKYFDEFIFKALYNVQKKNGADEKSLQDLNVLKDSLEEEDPSDELLSLLLVTPDNGTESDVKNVNTGKWHLPEIDNDSCKFYKGFGPLPSPYYRYVKEHPNKFEEFVTEIARHGIIDNTSDAKMTFSQIILGIDFGYKDKIPMICYRPQLLCFMVAIVYKGKGYAKLHKFFTFGKTKCDKDYDLRTNGRQYADTCGATYRMILSSFLEDESELYDKPYHDLLARNAKREQNREQKKQEKMIREKKDNKIE